MTTDQRNSVVVAALVTAMTCGAAVLMALAPKTSRFPRESALVARSGLPIRSVTIDYIAPAEVAASERYDCIITAEGAEHVAEHFAEGVFRIAVLGAADRRALGAEQKIKLIEVLGMLHQAHGVEVRAMTLSTRSTPEQTADPQAHDLHALLVKKAVMSEGGLE